ncbi:hypothetical protein D3C76_1502950 [compost metagenome]
MNWPESLLSFTSLNALTTSGLPATNPILHPVMLYDLDKECNSTPTSFAPGTDKKLSGFKPS